MFWKTTTSVGIVCLFAASWLSTTALVADTAFTYQGELKDNGSPANGSFNMSFALWNSVSALQLKTVDAPGAAKPLGRIDFVDQSDTLKAFMQGAKLGAGTVLDFSVTPGQPAQLSLNGGGVLVRYDLALDGDFVLNGDIDASGNSLTNVTGNSAVLGDIETTGSLDVNGTVSVVGDVGIGTSNPDSPLHVQRFGNQGIDGLVKVVRDAVSPGKERCQEPFVGRDRLQRKRKSTMILNQLIWTTN